MVPNKPSYSDDNLSLGRKMVLALVETSKTKIKFYQGSKIALNVYELIVQKTVKYSPGNCPENLPENCKTFSRKLSRKSSWKLSRKSSRKSSRKQ